LITIVSNIESAKTLVFYIGYNGNGKMTKNTYKFTSVKMLFNDKLL